MTRSPQGPLHRWPALNSLALLILLALGGLVTACSLDTDGLAFPGNQVSCTVAVRNPEGLEVEISTDLAMSLGFVDRPFYTCSSDDPARCPEPCGRRTLEDNERAWSAWVREEITRIAEDPDSSSIFRLNPGPWCRVPGTQSCETGPLLAGPPTCPAPSSSSPAEFCPAEPPGARCVEVDCGGGGGCEELAFGDVPVGQTSNAGITVRNCGEEPVRLRFDGRVTPLGAQADFNVPAAINTCLPTPEEALAGGKPLAPPGADPAAVSCNFEVHFSPQNPRVHLGELRFASTADPAHVLRLGGDGIGGVLEPSIPDLADPTAIPEALCFDAVGAAGCTVSRSIRLDNIGTGEVTVRRIEIGGAPENFEIQLVIHDGVRYTPWPPATPPPPPLVLPNGSFLRILVRWCDGGAGLTVGEVTVDSNDQLNPSVIFPLERISGTCAPGT